jgi:hypothetical protein
MSLHCTASLMGSEVSIVVRDRGFRRASLDGVLGWLSYVDSRPGQAEAGPAIDAASEILRAAGARDFRLEVRPRLARSRSRPPRHRFAPA